jgi:hypothetical protein
MTWISTDQERVQEVAGWRASYKSASVYAAERGYSPQSLRRWAKQLSPERSASSDLGFVRVEVVANGPAELKVEVGGACVRVARGFDPELLRSVVVALSERRDG